jgi:hypothetical protein
MRAASALVAALFASCDARGVNWYVASGNVAGNAALVASGAPLTGAYLCCGFFAFAPDGSFSLRSSAADWRAQAAVFTRAAAETWAVGSVAEAAVHSGAWAAGLPAAARAAADLLAAGLEGVIVDYEPADNYTQAHAAAYGAFLGALAGAVAPLRVGIDVADWGILGPAFWPAYSGVGVSRFTSMTPTYNALNVSRNREFVDAALAFFPPGAYAAGVGSVLAEGAPACGGGDFKWTNETFAPFVAFLGARTVEFVDVWRCDIDAPYDRGAPDATAPFFTAALARFLGGARGAPLSA